MYAVVEIAGKQFTLAAKDRVLVPTLKEPAGSRVTFDRVLMVGDDADIRVGNPVVKGAAVEATVIGPERAEKVIVFKKKKRKGYRVRRGHRQSYTRIEVTNIVK
jgi:large subunit ribosomal protein L21